MSGSAVLVRQARLLGREGDTTGAFTCYSRVLAEEPSHLEAVHFFGVLLAESRGSTLTSLLWIERSIGLSGDNAVFLTNKSIILQRERRFEEASDCIDQALRIQPLFVLALLNRGHVFKELKDYPSATDSYEKVVALVPDDVAAYEHLSYCYTYPEKLARRCRVLEQARSIEPTNADVCFGLGAYYLLAGRFSEGWDYLEYRWNASHVRDDSRYSKPLRLPKRAFDPQAPEGPVFIWCEQGIGDELMFSSLLTEFIFRFRVEVILQVDPRLQSVMSRSLPNVRVLPRGTVPSPDVYVSQMPAGDLPRLLRRSFSSFGAGSPGFLMADAVRVKDIRESLPRLSRPVVGISWHSSNGATRCIPLAELVGTLRRFNVSLVNLQYGDHEAEIRETEKRAGRSVFDFSEIDCHRDIEGLIALISCCDLVVSIGNATVHFAGGLGIQTVALLPHFPGWRWLSHGENSLWYQSVRLLRQERTMNWDSVLMSLDDLLSTRFDRR
jgi:hypothetical protein